MGCYKDLKDKRVVVTGGASGIGLATVQRFIKEEARVACFDYNEKKLDELKKECPDALPYKVDVSSFDEVKQAFEKTDKEMGGIDVLVANAGISVRNKIIDIPPEQWNNVIGINLNGVFHCAQQAGRRMKNQGSGVILMTSSVNGLEGHKYYADYNASKAGVILLSKTLALELAPNVRAVAVCPGYVMTPMQIAEYTEKMFAKANAKIPLGHHARPEDIAALFAFLASKEACHINGTTVTIDGGQMAGF